MSFSFGKSSFLQESATPSLGSAAAMCSSTVAVYGHTAVKMRSRQMYSPTLLPGIVSFVQFVLSSNRPNHFILKLDCAIISKTHFSDNFIGFSEPLYTFTITLFVT